LPNQLSLAVVGADHPNKSGPARRFEIAMCIPGERVDLVPEPKNPKDPRAIAVMSERGIQIGYVRAERCQLVHTYMRRGPVIAVFQQAEPWGATIRVSFGGEAPELPDVVDRRRPERDSLDQRDDSADDWWPDEIWPDD